MTFFRYNKSGEDLRELLEIINQQASTINLTNELALLREQVAYLTQKLYGKSSRRYCIKLVSSAYSVRKAYLTCPVETETITYRRKKAKGIRQAIFSQFIPEIVHHELQGEDGTCPDCHGQLGCFNRPTSRINLYSCAIEAN